MRCLSCAKLSIKPICKECKEIYFQPKMIKKEVGNLEVISFFEYYPISELIKSKYETKGYRFYKYIAKTFFQPFIKAYIDSYKNSKTIYLIGIDENLSRGYSNIAILTHYATIKSRSKALHNTLIANNRVTYAGKSLEYRLNNPRDFKYKGLNNIDAILIDDVVTTGATLEEASRVLKSYNINIHFALTVANAKVGFDY